MKEKLEMTALEMYMRVIAVLFILVIGYGIFCPMLVNDSEADILVGLGYLLVFAVPVLCVWVLLPIIKYLKNKS